MDGPPTGPVRRWQEPDQPGPVEDADPAHAVRARAGRLDEQAPVSGVDQPGTLPESGCGRDVARNAPAAARIGRDRVLDGVLVRTSRRLPLEDDWRQPEWTHELCPAATTNPGHAITIGTSRPHDLAHFYARLLDLPVTADNPPVPGDPIHGGWAQVRPPDGVGDDAELRVRAVLHPAGLAEHRGRSEPDPAPRHRGGRPRGEPCAGPIELGATLAEFQPQDDVRVLFDVDGHPFCLFVEAG